MANISEIFPFSHLFQPIIVGFVLGWYTLELIASIKATKINGWITIFGCGVPGNGMMMRAACVKIFPGPINVPEEAMYWTTTKDGMGHKLNGRYDYIMHFPAGQLPPNNAFWSLTMGDAKQRYVPNPLNRYSVGDRSGLVPNADGSVDIYIQHTAPAGHESNWLPAPTGYFIPWLRVYQPGAAILDGTYQVPPIVRVRSTRCRQSLERDTGMDIRATHRVCHSGSPRMGRLPAVFSCVRRSGRHRVGNRRIHFHLLFPAPHLKCVQEGGSR